MIPEDQDVAAGVFIFGMSVFNKTGQCLGVRHGFGAHIIFQPGKALGGYLINLIFGR